MRRILSLLVIGVLIYGIIVSHALAAGRGTCGAQPCGAYTDSTEINGFIVDNSANLIFKSATSATERLRITATSSVGLGLATPKSSIDFSAQTDGLLLQTASAASAASCAYAGAVRYNSNLNYIEFCNGTVWAPFVAQKTVVTPTGFSGVGYFVMTQTTYDGNLGNTLGADAKCLTELTTNTAWLGYSSANSRGLLNANHVFALISTYNEGHGLIPLTTYNFARVGAGSVGGASFTTDVNGLGPNDSANWSGSTYFGVSTTYRGTMSNPSNTAWGLGSALCCGFGDCTQFSTNDSGTNGWSAITNSTDSNRWLSAQVSCNTALPMICFVNP